MLNNLRYCLSLKFAEEYLLNIAANQPKWSAQNTQGTCTTLDGY